MLGHQLATVDIRSLVSTLADRLGFPPPSAIRDKRDMFALSTHRAEVQRGLAAGLACSNTQALSARRGRCHVAS